MRPGPTTILAGLALAGAMLAGLAAPAAATDMPRYDVDAHCRAVAEFGGSYSAVMENGCFDLEQQAYDALKPHWNELPEAMREHCDEVARLGGDGSYSMLKGCIDLELEAGREREGKTFRF